MNRDYRARSGALCFSAMPATLHYRPCDCHMHSTSTEKAAVLPTAGAAEPRGLRARTMAGGGWIVAEYGLGQILRFVGNLVLAYMLARAGGETAREAFGLMAMVSVVLQGLQMFSDVGLGPSIIRSRHGEDPRFLNTAWTVQVFRGVILWIVGCALAYPISLLWGYELRHLLPVAALTAVMLGLNSTSLYLLNRRLDMQPVARLRLLSQAVAVVVMIAWAAVSPTVWALVGGTLVGNVVRLVGSHRLRAAPRHRLDWHGESVRELFGFGRWIFLGTLLAFLAKQIDKLLLGALFNPALLGVFWIATQLSEMAPQLVARLSNSVGFAALAELYRRDPPRFRSRLAQVRLMLLLPGNGGQLLLLVLGPPIAVWLYPPAFGDVGWLLRMMVIASLARTLTYSYLQALLVIGSSFRHMLSVASLLLLTVGCALAGYAFAPQWNIEMTAGFVYGLAIAPWLHYPIIAAIAARSGFWQPKLDLVVLAVCGAVIGLVLWVG